MTVDILHIAIWLMFLVVWVMIGHFAICRRPVTE